MVTVLKLNKVHIKNGSVKPKERDFKMCGPYTALSGGNVGRDTENMR